MDELGSRSDLQPTGGRVRLHESARDMLISVFGDLAGSEALTRALVAERTEQRDDAMMWLEVYRLVCANEESIADAEVVRV